MSSSEAGSGSAVRDGYKEVQLGPKTYEVPNTWEKAKIREVTETVTRGKQPDYAEDSDTKVINQSCIYWDGFREDELKALKDDVAAKWKDKYFVHKGDILLNSTGKGTLGRAFYWGRDTDNYVLDSHVTRISTNHEEMHPEFFRYYLESTHGQTMLYTYCVSGSTGQIELSKTDLNGMPVLLPTLPEQRRIADVLSTVDEEIQQTDEIIETTMEMKQGMMQDLFSEGVFSYDELADTRIGEVPSHWSVDRIDGHAEIISGTHVKSDLVSSDSSLTPYLTGPADFERIGVSVTKYTDSPVTFCEPNDTLVVVKGMGCGQSAFAESRISISRQLKAIRPNETLYPCYLFYWIRYKEEMLNILAEGTRQPGLSTSDIESFPIPVPEFEEQQKIADSLAEADQKITEEMSKKQHLQELKRGLMQDLLTGQVRVTPDD